MSSEEIKCPIFLSLYKESSCCLATTDIGGVDATSLLRVCVGDCGKVEIMLAVFNGESVPALIGIEALESNLVSTDWFICFRVVWRSETIISSINYL